MKAKELLCVGCGCCCIVRKMEVQMDSKILRQIYLTVAIKCVDLNKIISSVGPVIFAKIEVIEEHCLYLIIHIPYVQTLYKSTTVHFGSIIQMALVFSRLCLYNLINSELLLWKLQENMVIAVVNAKGRP